MARYSLERGAVPLHRQVYLDLRSAIDGDEWGPGDRLPPERELAQRYGCSLITVRRALDELAREGRLERTRGRGTFVTEPPMVRDSRGRTGVAEEIRAVGYVPHARVDGGEGAVDGTAGTAAVIAVDIGNSKTDVALVAVDGDVLSAVRGPTGSHQQIGAEGATATLVALVEEAARRGGLDPSARPVARVLSSSTAGADYPSDIRLLTGHFRRPNLAGEIVVVNDCYGGLRAGTSRSWGVCVICGSGMNCLGVAPNGRTARFDALGEMSGDWGGGRALGAAGLAAAVRSEDGRGPKTSLESAVAAHFGRRRARAVTAALYRGEIWRHRLHEIAPLVFDAAGEGDSVARAIVDRQADEIVAWAAAAIRRLQMQRLDPEVVLAGGVFRAEEPGFYARIADGIARVAPHAAVVRLEAPPVVGAALIGLERLLGRAVPPEVERRLREGLTDALLAASPWAPPSAASGSDVRRE